MIIPSRIPVHPKYLLNENISIVFFGQLYISELYSSVNGAYTQSDTITKSFRIVLTILPILLILSNGNEYAVGFPGFTINKPFIDLSFNLLISESLSFQLLSGSPFSSPM